MCSNLEEPIKALRCPIYSLDKCKRCDKSPFVCLQKKDPFCRDCFHEYCTHKFRATIGKSKLVKPYDPVLVCFSGGSSSIAMLDLIIDGMQNPDHRRKLLVIPSLLYIREQIYGEDSEVFDKKEKIVLQSMMASKLNCFVSSIEMVYNSNEYDFLENDFRIPTSTSAKNKLMDKLDKISSFTAKEDYIRILRLRLIQAIAAREHVNFVISGETCTRTAILTLADLSQGKGSQIVSQQAFCDSRFAVKILRPMREFVKKEVTFWNLMRDNIYVEWIKFTTKTRPNSSIEKLTEFYINGLEKDFPSTVYTIFKTGNKLMKPKEYSKKCHLCQSIKDEINICSAFNALKLSHSLSKGLNTEESSGLHPLLCYSCNALLSEMTVSTQTQKKASEIDISEYLL